MIGKTQGGSSNDWNFSAGLRTSFIHLQGVGPTTERRLWRRGLATWDHLLGHADGDRYRSELDLSHQRYEARDWKHFDAVWPGGEKWRAFGDLGDRALYVDIETDGGIDEDSITVIGCYDGVTAHTFVRDRDLDRARDLIEDHPLIVTFNGAQFDLPVIRRRFSVNLFNHIHIDLRFPLKRLGYSGGLKAIEQRLGIERSEATRGLNGWDAVELWRHAQHGNEAALELLLAYNREDTKNMKPLMEMVYRDLSEELARHAAP